MTTGSKEHLIAWLREAHAMELQAQAMLQGHAARLLGHPEPLQRLLEHIRETHRKCRQLALSATSRCAAVRRERTCLNPLG